LLEIDNGLSEMEEVLNNRMKYLNMFPSNSTEELTKILDSTTSSLEKNLFYISELEKGKELSFNRRFKGRNFVLYPIIRRIHLSWAIN